MRQSTILVKNHDFSYPTTPLGRSPSEYCRKVWYRKTKIVWPPDGEKSLRIYLLVLMQYTNAMDRQPTMAQAALILIITDNSNLQQRADQLCTD